jgi:hypothetical protein
MSDKKQPVPRVLVFAAAVSVGVLLAVVAKALLAHLGLDLGALWQTLAVPRASHLRAAFAWWLIAGLSFIGGFAIAAIAKFLMANPTRFHPLRWLGGAVTVAGLTVVGHGATAPSGLKPLANVTIGVAVLALAGVLSLLGAYFAVRR